MLGFYRAVAKLRAYFLRPVGLAARKKACWRWWQIPSRFARTEQARDEGRERELPRLIQSGARHLAEAGSRILDCGVDLVYLDPPFNSNAE